MTDVKPGIANPRRRTLPKDRLPDPEVEKPLVDSLIDDPEKVTPTVYKAGVLVRPLTDIYETIAGFVMLADPVCGQAIAKSAPAAAKSLDELARVNPAVRKALMRLVAGGVTGKVVMAHLPIIMAIMMHHFPKAITSMQGLFLGKEKEDVPS